MTLEDKRKQRILKKLVKKNNIKEIVRFINENKGNDEIDFTMIWEVYDISEELFLKVFDENGMIKLEDEKNIWRVLFNTKLKKMIIKMYPEWFANLSDLQKKYVMFALKYPEVDEVFRDLIPDDKFSDCFDGEKLTDNFYSFALRNIELCKELLGNRMLKKGFNELEIKFIKNAHKLDRNIDTILHTKDFKRDDLNLYFDGSKMLPMYYKELFKRKIFHFCHIEGKVEQYYKYFNLEEVAFIKLLSGNDVLIEICKDNNINLDNFNEYFLFENDKLKLKKEVVNKALEESRFDLLLLIDSIDYMHYGLKENHIFLLKKINEIEDPDLMYPFFDSIKSNPEILNYDINQMESFMALFNLLMEELKNTNSKEIHKFRNEILVLLMKHDNPKRTLELMNEVYTKNNLPDVGKSYLIFKLLHNDYGKFNFNESSKMSPVLKNCKNDTERDIIIFSDLLKAAFGSNNRCIRDYLINIKAGNELFLKGDFNNLNEKEKQILKVFVKHLFALYNNTLKGKDNPVIETGDLVIDLENLYKSFSVSERHSLPDRIVRSFGYYAGFKTFNDAWEYFVAKKDIADKKNRLHADKVSLEGFRVEEGDFIKGIKGLAYFETILQNGSLAKEFLAIGSTTDATPLDTDLVRVSKKNETLENLVNDSKAASFGPIFFVLRNNDGITITRDDKGNEYGADSTNLEAFFSKPGGHYGIRTGFATSEVDYIIVKNDMVSDLLPKMKHIIVNNGFYIPILDNNGNLLFSPKEYDMMKKKISGLKHYTDEEFLFSSTLDVDGRITEIKETINKKVLDADLKKKKINQILSAGFKNVGIEFKDYFDSDISLGNVQLIDTGSTGRGTQTGSSTDFDFIMRIDSNMDISYLKEIIFDALGVSVDQDTMKNIRLKNVSVDETLPPIDIDISFVYKSDTNFYSTDQALKDRLEQIKLQDENKYKDVIANIILAKSVLKEAGVYKPNHARENAEGGLGGVGIENWLLQHGGSFYDAAVSFVSAAKGKTFEEFMKVYKIWDYGYNFYTGDYDEFVSQNMSKEGYNKMRTVLEAYLKTVRTDKKEYYVTPSIGYEFDPSIADSYHPGNTSRK